MTMTKLQTITIAHLSNVTGGKTDFISFGLGHASLDGNTLTQFDREGNTVGTMSQIQSTPSVFFGKDAGTCFLANRTLTCVSPSGHPVNFRQGGR